MIKNVVVVACVLLINPSFVLRASEHHIRIDVAGKTLKLYNSEDGPKAVVEALGQPDVVVLPTLLPLDVFFASKLTLFYKDLGLVVRFGKEAPNARLVISDVFLFYSGANVAGVEIQPRSARIEYDGRRMDDLVRGGPDVLVEQYDAIYSWGR